MIIVALAFVVGLWFLKTRFPLGEKLLPVIAAGEATATPADSPAPAATAPGRSAEKPASGDES
jgi:hypothetical protein